MGDVRLQVRSVDFKNFGGLRSDKVKLAAIESNQYLLRDYLVELYWEEVASMQRDVVDLEMYFKERKSL